MQSETHNPACPALEGLACCCDQCITKTELAEYDEYFEREQTANRRTLTFDQWRKVASW